MTEQLHPTKKVSLAEVHEWIETARKILETEDGSMLDCFEVFVMPDEGDDVDDIACIDSAFRWTLHQVIQLDLAFHEMFDCR